MFPLHLNVSGMFSHVPLDLGKSLWEVSPCAFRTLENLSRTLLRVPVNPEVPLDLGMSSSGSQFSQTLWDVFQHYLCTSENPPGMLLPVPCSLEVSWTLANPSGMFLRVLFRHRSIFGSWNVPSGHFPVPASPTSVLPHVCI